MKISAIIMASGQSKRFGENKLLKKYGNKKICEYTMDLVEEIPFHEKILVSAYDEVLKLGEKRKMITVKNNDNHRGKSRSIDLGLEKAEDVDGYLFFVADQPLLKKETVEKIIDEFKKKRTIVLPRWKNQRGNPVLFPRRYKGKLQALDGDKGGACLIKEGNHFFVEVEEKEELWDIDTKESYERLITHER
ncbi:MAG: NTP transferase domain-containing protein [Tissierellia bacterium]|nr:NTP transferase domain-containing protein [Tissierellia bacterium]